MYTYRAEREKIFTDEGQREFLKVKAEADKLLEIAGAFKLLSATKHITGDSWLMIAYVDRMVELGLIVEITGPNVAGQDRVFVSA